MKIGARETGPGFPCFIVGEVAQAHEGSVSLAHAYIDAIADAGADAVKFQCHLAEAESTPDEPWRVKPKWGQDASRYEYWRRMEFTEDQWAELSGHAHGRNLAFIVSPFSVEAVRLLLGLVDAWKVASGEVTHADLLVAIAATGVPVIVSTGMSTCAEIEEVKPAFGGKMALLQCTSMYPTPPSFVGLGVMAEMRKRFRCPVGLSDHSGTIYAGLGAVTLGADLLEVHVTLSRETQGFDTASSITPSELRSLVKGAWFLERARGTVDKDSMADALAGTRLVFADKWKRRKALV